MSNDLISSHSRASKMHRSLTVNILTTLHVIRITKIYFVAHILGSSLHAWVTKFAEEPSSNQSSEKAFSLLTTTKAHGNS